MRKSIVAIVGRPNVGKSTLFNRLCKKRSAIVDFESGITRDRKHEEVEWNGKVFIIVDTGGIVPSSIDTFDKAIRFQAEIAIQEADSILFVVDAKTGATADDMEIARILATHREKVMLVANKVDSEKDDMELYDFLQLGFGEAFPISASHGRNTGNFLDELLELIPQTPDIIEDDDAIKVAIVGKPNVGKSSFINKLFGEERMIVTDIAGTTRDSIDLKLNYKQQKLTFIDTAGLRRKTKVKYGVEYFSSMRTIDSVERADLVLLMLDATEEVSDQDQKIASHAKRKYKDIIFLINKWDLIAKDNKTFSEFMKKIQLSMPFLDYVPCMFISALTGQRVHSVLDKIIEVSEESNKRIPTAQLNKFLEGAIFKNAPNHKTGKHIKISYCTQNQVHPPTFLFFCNKPELISVSYKRYLHNRIREEFNFSGATIKLLFRGKDHDTPDIEY